jgi:hypothetical protein
MRTPWSALPAWPYGLVLGFGKPFGAAALAVDVLVFSFMTFLPAGFFTATLALGFLALLRIAMVTLSSSSQS